MAAEVLRFHINIEADSSIIISFTLKVIETRDTLSKKIKENIKKKCRCSKKARYSKKLSQLHLTDKRKKLYMLVYLLVDFSLNILAR